MTQVHQGPRMRHRSFGYRRADALRRVLLRVGKRLGLDAPAVAVVAESACGRPWPSLGQGELLLVLDTLGEVAAGQTRIRYEGRVRRGRA